MYTVRIGHECACFKKSDYKSVQEFNFQKDAYNYANTVSEFMNEDFCTTHTFTPKIVNDTEFVIIVADNPNAGSCSTGSCGPCGCD